MLLQHVIPAYAAELQHRYATAAAAAGESNAGASRIDGSASRLSTNSLMVNVSAAGVGSPQRLSVQQTPPSDSTMQSSPGGGWLSPPAIGPYLAGRSRSEDPHRSSGGNSLQIDPDQSWTSMASQGRSRSSSGGAHATGNPGQRSHNGPSTTSLMLSRSREAATAEHVQQGLLTAHGASMSSTSHITEPQPASSPRAPHSHHAESPWAAEFHARGINMRHLGLLRSLVPSTQPELLRLRLDLLEGMCDAGTQIA